MEPDMIIETVNLTKQYGHQRAVDNLSFKVKEGELFGFLGPNGAGKTTALLMMLGLSRPSGGYARICGLDPLRKARDVKRLTGYLPEHIGFYGDLDAVQSLEYVASLNGIQKDKVSDKIDELLELVGLKKDARKKVGAFSRGMKQRLGIAEVLIKDPKVLLLDEPTLGLDPDGSARVMGLVQSLNQDRKITVVLCSHNLYQVQKMSHRVGIMIDGKMIAEGPIESLAKEKFGIGEREYSLEEVYMRYFEEV